MSKTPFTREHRETLQQLLQDWDIQGYAAEAVRAALEHLPEPEPEPEPLPNGPYLYRRPGLGGYSVRFIHDGKATGFTSRDFSGPGPSGVSWTVRPEDHDHYEPITLIRGEGEAPADMVDRVYQRVGMGIVPLVDRYAVRRVLQALIDEVGQ